MLSPSNIILRIQRLVGKQCRSRRVARYEPPHQDICCLQIQLYLSPVLKELMMADVVCSGHTDTIGNLPLKFEPIMTAADDTHSYSTNVRQRIHMKNQASFSLKD